MRVLGILPFLLVEMTCRSGRFEGNRPLDGVLFQTAKVQGSRRAYVILKTENRQAISALGR